VRFAAKRTLAITVATTKLSIALCHSRTELLFAKKQAIAVALQLHLTKNVSIYQKVVLETV
jgi:hypothetical protein